MNTEIMITSADGVIQIKQKQNNLMFVEVAISDGIAINAQEILTYVENLKSPEERVEIALAFIAANATVEQKLTLVAIYPEWEKAKEYVVGKELQYKKTLYSVIQAHTSQSDWTPDIKPALFKVIKSAGATKGAIT